MGNPISHWLDSDIGHSFKHSKSAMCAAVIAFLIIRYPSKDNNRFAKDGLFESSALRNLSCVGKCSEHVHDCHRTNKLLAMTKVSLDKK